MAPLLREGLSAFLASYEAPYVRGLRLNPLKPCRLPEGETDGFVPWEKDGLYLNNDSLLGAGLLHEAGGFYIQEPSAMAAVAALKPQPGETVLDLCAAPGGKSTQIAGRMMGEGLLVSNEIVPNRAAILSRNLERMGVANALVVNSDPPTLARLWPGAFDAVLVDAPCSGEGMFRRHPETRTEWTTASPIGCAQRQLEILNEAAKMVRPGGRLTYSTCTLNSEEDENTAEKFLAAHPDFEPLPFTLPGVARMAPNMTKLWPHLIRGEGHFVACFRRLEGDGKTTERGTVLPAPDKALLSAFAKVAPKGVSAPNGMLGGKAVLVPPLLPVRRLRVLRAGLQLGEIRGNIFTPDHAWAMTLPPFPRVELTGDEGMKWLHGETIDTSSDVSGWCVATYDGLPLGFGKISGGQMKNHYPKGLRK